MSEAWTLTHCAVVEEERGEGVIMKVILILQKGTYSYRKKALLKRCSQEPQLDRKSASSKQKAASPSLALLTEAKSEQNRSRVCRPLAPASKN